MTNEQIKNEFLVNPKGLNYTENGELKPFPELLAELYKSNIPVLGECSFKDFVIWAGKTKFFSKASSKIQDASVTDIIQMIQVMFSNSIAPDFSNSDVESMFNTLSDKGVIDPTDLVELRTKCSTFINRARELGIDGIAEGDLIVAFK